MEENTPKPRRFWRPRFGLRSLFVLVTVVCVWLAWSMNWIRQRQEAISSKVIQKIEWESGAHVNAPCGLWLFGEEGVRDIAVHPATERES